MMDAELKSENMVYKFSDKIINGASKGGLWSLQNVWSHVRNTLRIPVSQIFIKFIYSLYANLTVLNVRGDLEGCEALGDYFRQQHDLKSSVTPVEQPTVQTVYSVKYIPMVFYMYQFIKKTYKASRERIERIRIAIEDLQLQVEIIDTKLQACEFASRQEQLSHAQDRLKRIRARVRDVITRNEMMRQAVHAVPEEDSLFFLELMKDFKFDPSSLLEFQQEGMDCGEGDIIERIPMERAQTEPSTPEHSVYSSLSDIDIKQDYRVKIVKVTNVYKVAYLKHFIKQKRLRKANKQAMLRKKVENIKKLLGEWQRTLDMVINSKVTVMNMEPRPSDINLQTNYPTLDDRDEMDAELNNSFDYSDDFSLSSAQDFYRNNGYNEDSSGTFYDDYPEMGYTTGIDYIKTNNKPNLPVVPEETMSQVKIEEITTEENACNLIVL